jgi:predicted KAP-like P-loop ATPase
MIDNHICDPTDDLFGFGDFGGALGRAIAETKNPEGTVIGLSGPWGSGKTSVIETYVVPALKEAKVKIVQFDPWAAIEGRDLILEFLSSLQGALPREIARQVSSTLTAIARLAVPIVRDSATAIATAAGATLGLPGVAAGAAGSKAFAKASDWASGRISDRPLGQRLAWLRERLKENDQRIVFLIDDLDRLPPDELLLVFRMLRTVGRLPNVVHLLAIDRHVAERVVTDRFPAEGASYLDKIVQTWFEVPTPHPKALERAVLDGLCRLAELNQHDAAGLENDAVFGRAVLPLLETPRDLKRLLGALELVWPALKGDVHIGDLAALEAMKLRHVETYRAVRRYEAWVSDPMSRRSLGEPPKEEEIARVFRVPGKDQPEARKRVLSALAALFPREIGQSVDGPDVAASVSDDQDHRDRRLRSLEHFHAYFRLAGSADTLRAGEERPPPTISAAEGST